MAHIEKYKAQSVGHMLAHYARSRSAVLERDNVDETRTHLNYTVGLYQKDGRGRIGKVSWHASWETVEGRIESVQNATGRRVRKDAVVMADLVVTAPQNVPERDLERFFCLCYQYMARQVGMGNLMGGYVHMDETTPHMHVPFTPIKDGRFNYKGLCPRSFYQQLHKGLGDHLEKSLGYRPEIELGEERLKEKVLSSVPQAKLDQARAAILEPLERERDALAGDYERVAAELEAVKREVAALQESREALEAENERLREQGEEQRDRLESLRQAADGVAANVEVLEAVASDVRGFENASRSGKSEILARIAERCDGCRERVARAVERLRLQVGRIRRRALVPERKQLRHESPRQSVENVRQSPQIRRRAVPGREHSAGLEL